MKPLFVVFGSLLLSACSVFGHSGVEEVPYSVLEKDGAFEIRQYDETVVAKTYVRGDYDDMTDVAFNRLFEYISGANKSRQEVEMTAPVLVEDRGQDIAMTAPVFIEDVSSKAEQSQWSMAFALPAKFTKNNAPDPTNTDVVVEAIRNQKFAALRFSGFMGEDVFSEKAAELKTWLNQTDYQITGAPIMAGYNPPWTIPAFRRNEILIPIQ
jgi:hypothetical protein